MTSQAKKNMTMITLFVWHTDELHLRAKLSRRTGAFSIECWPRVKVAVGTYGHGTKVRVAVSQQLVQCHSKGPDVRGDVKFTLD